MWILGECEGSILYFITTLTRKKYFQTKKKVTGSTNYNKKQKALTVKNLKESDFGDYMTGNKKVVKNLHKLIVKG